MKPSRRHTNFSLINAYASDRKQDEKINRKEKQAYKEKILFFNNALVVSATKLSKIRKKKKL